MTKYYTAEQMREIDRKAIEDYEIPGIILMENAGRGAADAAMELISDDRPVGIFAGKGNNGGDAFVVARHLHNRRIPVEMHMLGGVSAIRPGGDAWTNMNAVRKMGIEIHEIKSEADVEDLDLSRYGLVVDGLLGTGLSGEVGGNYRTLIEKINASSADVLALDIPSGLSADTGAPLGAAVRAKATTT